MQFNKNKIIAGILFALVGLVDAYAQSEIDVYWEIRNYYIDANNPQVEVFLVIADTVKKKELIFFSAGEAVEIPVSEQFYRLNTWHLTASCNYRFKIEKSIIRILKQELEYSREIRDFVPVQPGWQEIKKIPISPNKEYFPQAGKTLSAKSLFSRTLLLQTKRMNGDDVWALQRFLVEQGFTEAGDIDGWFGPHTEKAVKKFQAGKQIKEDGIVDQSLWDIISGL